MPGLVPGIPLDLALPCHVHRDGRDKPGHDSKTRFPGAAQHHSAKDARPTKPSQILSFSQDSIERQMSEYVSCCFFSFSLLDALGSSLLNAL
jgi:hypothetical protein